MECFFGIRELYVFTVFYVILAADILKRCSTLCVKGSDTTICKCMFTSPRLLERNFIFLHTLEPFLHFSRCFTKPKFTFEEAEEKPKPSEDDRKKLTEVQQVPAPVRTPSPLSQMLVSTVTPSVIKIEPADNMVAQAVSIISDRWVKCSSGDLFRVFCLHEELSFSSSPEKVKGNEFSCALCPYGTSTRSNLMRHEAKHQVKDLFNVSVGA